MDYSNGGFMSVNYHGRIVGVRVSHIGIDEEFIAHIMSQSAYKKDVDKFKWEFKKITEAAKKSCSGNFAKSLAYLHVNM